MTGSQILAFFIRLPATTGLILIRVYQVVFSPMKAGLFGPGAACRFYPTCSDYGLEAIRSRGLLLGVGLTTWRILKCHPFHAGGYDPVPSRRADRKQNGCSHGCSH